MKKIIDVLNQDFVEIVIQKWHEVPSLYKKAFLVIFTGLNIVFAFHTINFMLGNHDWNFAIYGIRFNDLFSVGRYFLSSTTLLFLHGEILPIFSNVIGFMEYSLAAVLLCFYWKLPKSLLLYSITGLLLVIQPYTITWLYFSYQTISNYGIILFSVIACIVGERASEFQYARGKRILYVIISLFLFVFCIGTYGPALNTIAVVFLGRIFIDFLNSDISKKNVVNVGLKHIYTWLTAVGACVIHYIIVSVFKAKGMLVNVYTTETLHLNEIPARFIDIVEIAFKKLLFYPVTFFSSSFTYIFTVLLCIMLLSVVFQIIYSNTEKRKKVIKILVLIAILILTLISTMAASFISRLTNFYVPRVDMYGFGIFHILAVVVLFSARVNILKSICMLGCVILLQISIIQNATAQKVWKFGFEAEKMMWNRLLTRIETTPGFIVGQKYKLLLIGALKSLRGNYLPDRNKLNCNCEMLADCYDPGWSPFTVVEFYSYSFIDGEFRRVFNSFRDADEQSKNMMFAMLPEIERAKVWPDKSSVIIKGDILLVVMDQLYLDKLREFIKENQKSTAVK
ncbi:MAG: glucosyltransferase domain-containing protein [Endomicrobium sp.]|jgi:hypothetical protein|nr:glucosyltransferase domain-containing protein [Endomicrobium sp.]